MHIKERQARPAKRRRLSQDSSTDGDDEDGYTEEVEAYSGVLSACSTYSARALSGQLTQTTTRRVELTVGNKQELEDFKLLLKLSYSDRYTHDGDQLLPTDTRLRMAALADALEFKEAVDQLWVPLSFAQAVRYINNTSPELLLAHPDTTRERLVVELVKDIEALEAVDDEDDAEAEDQMQAGVTALAKYLGHVSAVFKHVAGEPAHGTLSLREEVSWLPCIIFTLLLESKELDMQVENEAYVLFTAWLHASPHVAGDAHRLALFKNLAKPELQVLRYNRMHSEFVAMIVSQCPLTCWKK